MTVTADTTTVNQSDEFVSVAVDHNGKLWLIQELDDAGEIEVIYSDLSRPTAKRAVDRLTYLIGEMVVNPAARNDAVEQAIEDIAVLTGDLQVAARRVRNVVHGAERDGIIEQHRERVYRYIATLVLAGKAYIA